MILLTSVFFAIAAYLMTNIFLASMCLVCTVVTTNFHQHNTSTKPPKWLTVLAYVYIARLIGIRRIESESKEAIQEPIYGEQLHGDTKRRNSDVGDAAVTVPTVLKSHSTHEPPDGNQDHPGISKPLTALTRSVDAKQEEKEAQSLIQSEWSSIGAIFDRFFFLLFLTATISEIVIMIVVYPMFAAMGGETMTI